MMVTIAIASVATTVTRLTTPISRSRNLGSQRRSGAARAVTSAHVRRHELPVHQVLDEGLDVVRASVAIVDVVGVLPHVDREKGLGAVLHRQVGVGGLHDLESRTVVDEPGPTGTELRRGRFGELVGEVAVGTEGGVDGIAHGAGRL